MKTSVDTAYEKPKKRRVIRRIMLILFAIVLMIAAGIGIYLASIPRVSLNIDLLDGIGIVTTYLDADGDPIRGNFTGKNATFVPISALSADTVQMFVSTEDKKFYSHRGINVKRSLSAGANNLFHGKFREGASTITQQLAKNTHLSFDKKLSRKIQEIRLAKKIEQHYSKREILEKYLNVIYFGHNLYGLESASQFYFSKPASQLDLSESATLVAVINAPRKYSPVLNLANATKRRNLVLTNLYNDGKISKTQYDETIATPIALNICERTESYFVAAARAEVAGILSEQKLTGTGYVIRTTLNKRLQSILDNHSDPEFRQKIVLMDAKGHIVAANGSYDTVGLKRQPGSAIKPFLSYAPSIEKHIVIPATPILDEPINFGGFQPRNYGGHHSGWVTVRDALSTSNNIAAVKLMDMAGTDYCYDFAKNVGLDLDERDKSYAAALGGLTYGVTLEQLTGAFGTLQCMGKKVTPHYVTSIQNKHGIGVWTNFDTEEQVMSPSTANLVTDMLRSAATWGTSSKLSTLPFEVAAKTGTVGQTAEGNTDAYCLAYNTDYTVGVWYGSNATLLPNEIRGGTRPAGTARDVLFEIYSDPYRSLLPANFNYAFDLMRIDKNALDYDHAIAAAPDFAAERDVIYELKPSYYIPLSPKLFDPKIEVSKENGTVKLTLIGDRFANYRLIKESFYLTEVIPIGSLSVESQAVYYDESANANETASYRLLALYPNGSSRISSTVKVFN